MSNCVWGGVGGQIANGEGQGRDGRYRRRQDGSPAHLDLDLGFFLEVGRSLSRFALSLVSPLGAGPSEVNP